MSAAAASPPAPIDPAGLIVCPVCDALLRDTQPPLGGRARCPRCGAVLLTALPQAMTRIVMLAATALVLMLAGIGFPFLRISAGGRVEHSSLIDAVTAYSTGLLYPLTFALAALIVILPLVRLLCVLYTLAPMALGDRPWRHATAAFRLSGRLRPWAMAEVFIVGVAVALVKVADLARITLGPAFWALCALVVVNVVFDMLMCRLTVWKTLDARRAP
jgi:paraquat-inducible protein A